MHLFGRIRKHVFFFWKESICFLKECLVKIVCFRATLSLHLPPNIFFNCSCIVLLLLQLIYTSFFVYSYSYFCLFCSVLYSVEFSVNLFLFLSLHCCNIWISPLWINKASLLLRYSVFIVLCVSSSTVDGSMCIQHSPIHTKKKGNCGQTRDLREYK